MTMLKRICIDRMIRWLVLLSVIILCGCEELGIQDTTSLLIPQVSTIRNTGISGRVWHNLCRRARLVQDVQATVQPGHKPDDGRYHGCFSDCLGLLWSFDCVTAGDFVELDRRDHKFHDRLGIFSICSPRKE